MKIFSILLVSSIIIFIFIMNFVAKKNIKENLTTQNAVSACEKNGLTGTCYIMSDGSQECILPQDNGQRATKTSTPVETKKEPEKKQPTCNDILNLQKTAVLVASDCVMPSGETGIIFPRLGNRCVSRQMVQKCNERETKQAKTTKKTTAQAATKATAQAIPAKRSKNTRKCAANSTKCHNPKDMQFFETECNKIGNDWGFWKFQICNCEKGKKSGICRKGYHFGSFIEPNSTPCVFDYSDMNRICNDEMRLMNKKESINYGYKTITKNGCPPQKQRAICNGNYYSGEELIPNATDCFYSNTNFEEKCKNLLGTNGSVKQFSSYNCYPGSIRALCYTKI
jgi:hypothetical protein